MLAQVDPFIRTHQRLEEANVPAGEDVVPIAGETPKKGIRGVDMGAPCKCFLNEPPERFLGVPARVTAGKVPILQPVFPLILLLKVAKSSVHRGAPVGLPIAIV